MISILPKSGQYPISSSKVKHKKIKIQGVYTDIHTCEQYGPNNNTLNNLTNTDRILAKFSS